MLLLALAWAACGSTDSAAVEDSDTTSRACAEVEGPGATDPLVAPTTSPRNLLLLSIDTLRKDRVGRWSGLATTPFLDAWLDEALVLEDARSCSDWTAPAMLCLLTGTTPTEAGYEPHAGRDAVLVDVPEDLDVLASWLTDAGYVPALVTANAVVAAAQPASVDPRSILLLDRAPAEQVVDAGLEVHAALSGQPDPWFLHLHFNDPHSPYDPPEAWLGGLDGLDPSPVDLADEAAVIELSEDPEAWSEAERALIVEHAEVRYAGELSYLDDQLRRLWTALEDGGALDDTLVVLVSDHGEQFWEHGAFTHGFTLHLEEVDGVAALRGPEVTPGTWSGPTAIQDLAPTVLHALGLEVPESVTAPIVGTAPADRVRHGFRQRRDVPPQHVLTRADRRLFYEWSSERSFYRLDTDPREASDVYDAADPDLLCLWEHLAPWIAQAATFMTDYEAVDPEP